MNLNTFRLSHVFFECLARISRRVPELYNLGLADTAHIHAQSSSCIASIPCRINRLQAFRSSPLVALPLPLAMTGRCNGRRGRAKSPA